MSAIPGTWAVETGGSWFEDTLGKKLVRPYLKYKPDNVTKCTESG
jgi:hypothetical protein